MHEERKKIYLLFGSIAIFIAVFSAIYFLKFRDRSDQKKPETSQPSVQESSPKQNDGSIQQGSAEEQPLAEEKKLDEAPNEELRQKAIDKLIKNLDQLVFPPKDDKWDIASASIYFVGNSYLYLEIFPAEITTGGMKLLYKTEFDASGQVKLQELAKYKDGGEDWELISGEDKFFDYSYDEYGYDDSTDKWSQIDYMAESEFPIEEEDLTPEELKDLEEEEALLDEEAEEKGIDQAEKTIVP